MIGRLPISVSNSPCSRKEHENDGVALPVSSQLLPSGQFFLGRELILPKLAGFDADAFTLRPGEPLPHQGLGVLEAVWQVDGAWCAAWHR